MHMSCVELSIVCLKHFWEYVIPWAGNPTEEESRVFNEISGMTIIVPILCLIK
jgi:hypothetical protein